MTDPHAELAKYDQAVVEHEARKLADETGYTFGVLTDGTIVLEPPADASCCGICATRADVEHLDHAGNGGDACAGCGEKLTPLTRCQRVIMGDGLSFSLRFVCPKCYARESAG
jgi:hypothetical protein